MKVQELVKLWEEIGAAELAEGEYTLRLPIEQAAKLAALKEMYPLRSTEELIGDLLSAAIIDLESSFPYISGNKVVSTDEEGHPLYEDVGPTPRYLSLTRKHLSLYRQKKLATGF